MAAAGSPGYSDLVQASAILNGAIGYDVLHKFLSPDERTRCQDKLRQLTGNSANAADGGIWWVRDLVQNHNWVNFAAIGIAGQVLEGEETAAGHWRAIAQENYRKVKAVQDLIVDGSWHEGIGYMEFGLLPAIAHAMGAARRGNDNDKTSLLAKVGRYVLYTQLPNHPRIHVMTHGDWNWSRPSLVAVLRWAARRCADPYAQEAARRWELEAPNTSRDEYALAYALEYVAYDPGVPPLDLTTVPLDLYNGDQQSVIVRTSSRYGAASPDADGLVIGFKSGVLGGRGNFERIKQDRQNPHPDPGGILNIGHDHMDDLGLWIYGQGGWLLPEHVDYNCCTGGDLTGYSTTEHNSILVDGKGQYGDDRNVGAPKHNAVSNPWFFDREVSMQPASTDHYAFARGDGRLLYPPAANLQTLVRTIGLSRDGGFITLHDQAVLTAGHTIAQLFHYLNPDDATVTADRPWLKLNNNIPASGDTPRSDTLLGIRVLAPTGFTTTVATVRSHASYFVTIDNDGRFGRLTIATPAPRTSAIFLEVLWPAKVTQWNLRPTLQPLDANRPELGFQIALSGANERWIYNTAATAQAGGLALESGQIGVVRTDTAGSFQRLVLLGQGSLSQGGTTTLLLANPRPGAVEVALSDAGARAVLSGDGRLTGTRFHGPNVVAVWGQRQPGTVHPGGGHCDSRKCGPTNQDGRRHDAQGQDELDHLPGQRPPARPLRRRRHQRGRLHQHARLRHLSWGRPSRLGYNRRLIRLRGATGRIPGLRPLGGPNQAAAHPD